MLISYKTDYIFNLIRILKCLTAETEAVRSSDIMAEPHRSRDHSRITHSIEGKLLRKRSLSPDARMEDRTNFKASRHSAFRKVPSTNGNCMENIQTSISSKKCRNNSFPNGKGFDRDGLVKAHRFSVDQLLSNDSRTDNQRSGVTSFPSGAPRAPVGRMTEAHPGRVDMTSYPDPRSPFTSYWLNHLRTMQEGNVPPYMSMFSPYLYGHVTSDLLKPYMPVPPSLFHRVPMSPPENTLPADLRTHTRRSTGSSSTETGPDGKIDQSVTRRSSTERTNINEESFGFCRHESQDRGSDSERESDADKSLRRESSPLDTYKSLGRESSPSDRRLSDAPKRDNNIKRPSLSPIHRSPPHIAEQNNISPLHVYISPSIPDPTPLSILTQRRFHPHMPYPDSMQRSLLPPSMLGFPSITRRPRDPTKPAALKKYKCDICSKSFSRSNTLVTHRVCMAYFIVIYSISIHRVCMAYVIVYILNLHMLDEEPDSVSHDLR